jgi:hypothetical protein
LNTGAFYFKVPLVYFYDFDTEFGFSDCEDLAKLDQGFRLRVLGSAEVACLIFQVLKYLVNLYLLAIDKEL